MQGRQITRQIIAIIAISAASSLALAGCGAPTTGSASGDSTPIRIGALFPTSGALATLGQVSLDGAKIAVAMTNAGGGIDGRKIELVTGDASTAATAVSEATRLTTKDGVKIVMGTYASDLSKAASGAAIRNGAFYWETDAISDDLTARGLSNFFQFPYTASANGANAANMIKDLVNPVLGHPAKVVIVHNDSSYGALVASGAEKQAKANGLDVLGNFAYPTATTDQSSLALRIQQANPDAVIASSYQNDAVLLQNALRQQNVNLAAFVGTGGIYGLGDFAKALGGAVNGLLDTEGSANIPDDALTPDAQALRKKFFAEWEKDHDGAPGFLGTIAFDATWVLLHNVIANAKSVEPAGLRTAALALDLPAGSTILGYGVKFTDKGINERASVIGDQWQDGKLVVVYPKKFATGSAIDIPLRPWSER